jgi:hypothetical protein
MVATHPSATFQDSAGVSKRQQGYNNSTMKLKSVNSPRRQKGIESRCPKSDSPRCAALLDFGFAL